MRINSNDEMFGFSVIKLREFFKRYTDNWDVESIMYFLSKKMRQAS